MFVIVDGIFIVVFFSSCFSFLSVDYAAEFPLQGTVSFAHGAVLLNIIEDEHLNIKCLPLAISRVDSTLKHVGQSIKRSIERRVLSTRELSTLCCRIDFLYIDDNNVGNNCQSLNIDANFTIVWIVYIL